MRVQGKDYRTVWTDDARPDEVSIIDQRKLPFAFETEQLGSVDEVARAIRDMHVRGAGCIGTAAAYGMWLAAIEAEQENDPELALRAAASRLLATRPTAVNLSWAVQRQLTVIEAAGSGERVAAARSQADAIADEDVAACRAIGDHGLTLINEIAGKKEPGAPVHILTHCNAGWLAFTDWGTATAPVYAAHRAGIPVHVWVDETRPRNQGARLTAWELANEGVPHTVIVDNVGGHLMQNDMVDLVITGTDRTTYTGDVANKIGTYLKALAARDNGVPFFVALPSSTFDWQISDGLSHIPIEERSGDEVGLVEGLDSAGRGVRLVEVVNPGSPVANFAFDVTPARLVAGLITERGVCEASAEGIAALFPGHSP